MVAPSLIFRKRCQVVESSFVPFCQRHHRRGVERRALQGAIHHALIWRGSGDRRCFGGSDASSSRYRSAIQPAEMIFAVGLASWRKRSTRSSLADWIRTAVHEDQIGLAGVLGEDKRIAEAGDHDLGIDLVFRTPQIFHIYAFHAFITPDLIGRIP